jgi:uncharacterized protein (TIGR02001 family)
MRLKREAIPLHEGPSRRRAARATAVKRGSPSCGPTRWRVLLALSIAMTGTSPAAAADDWQFEAGAATDYYSRGIEASYRQPSVHVAGTWYPGSGFFAGASATSIRFDDTPQTGAEFISNAGYVWRFGGDWSAQAMLADYRFVKVPLAHRDDYDELVLTAGWRDSVFASIALSPNTGFGMSPRSRAVAYDIVGRLPLGHGFSATAGIGYYDIGAELGGGYVYGNAGLTYQYRAWQFDATYVASRASAPVRASILGSGLNDRWIADVIWHF